jgi:hypothetical protein
MLVAKSFPSAHVSRGFDEKGDYSLNASVITDLCVSPCVQTGQELPSDRTQQNRLGTQTELNWTKITSPGLVLHV